MEKLYHRGVMRSKVDDCQFVCIRQSDYYRILRQGEENTRRHEEDGVLVLVTEKSHIDTCHREANIVIKVRIFAFLFLIYTLFIIKVQRSYILILRNL